MLPDIDSGTENFHRESGRPLSSYVLIIFVLYLIYNFTGCTFFAVQESIEIMGWWGFLPLIVVCVSSVFMIAFVLFRRKTSSSR